MALINFDVTCRMCKTTTVLRVDHGEYIAWQTGLFIQKAFPKMSVANRELLISKTCDACWKKLFGE